MRPLSITLEGFSAYRRKQGITLENVEFFSLSGPTGSGKSSLIDAMIFALYGRVPRLGARAVAPAITAGADRARVMLEFEVGEEAYVVSRVAERTDSGASVREARLERADGTPLASGTAEVTREVEALLRLRFDDFTKTVVLPQGEFARFLNSGSAERRELLRDLLGLEVYSRVRELATIRKSVAAERAHSARTQIESLDLPDEDVLAVARARLENLDEVADSIGDRMEALEKAEAQLGDRERGLERIDDARSRLRDMEAPAHLEQMDQRVVATREAESLADKVLRGQIEEIARLDSCLEALPSQETIDATRQTHSRLSDLEARMASLDIDAAGVRVARAEASVAGAEQERADAKRAVESSRVLHAAHAVKAALVVGEPCPVCDQEVATIPDTAVPQELVDVDERLQIAETRLADIRSDLEAARVSRSELEARRSEMASQLGSLIESLEKSASLDELLEAERKRDEATKALDAARAELADLETAHSHARRAHEEASEAVRSVGRVLMAAREQIADLKPPLSESDDPTVQWKELLSWRDQRLDGLASERITSVAEVDRQRGEVADIHAGLVRVLTGAGVPVEQPYAVQVAREREIARQRVSTMEDVVRRVDSLQERLKTASEDEAVAGALVNHLKANGFERWLMAGAITRLVSGANELLSQLSAGGYSLESDADGAFRIIDHRNADEIRDVATLSGGETFLVSLALSLSLAETLSAAGGSGLDAIILDEGFGTLDDESLDLVATVLEELAGRGLMVGVITHVKELAARAPVRYQVTREPEGSRVVELT